MRPSDQPPEEVMVEERSGNSGDHGAVNFRGHTVRCAANPTESPARTAPNGLSSSSEETNICFCPRKHSFSLWAQLASPGTMDIRSGLIGMFP